MRRVPSVDNLIPVRYLKGISTGDFSEALVSIPGEGVRGGVAELSPGHYGRYERGEEGIDRRE